MKTKLLSKKVIKGIFSASGIELFEGKFYIIGDDSSWLFILDKKLNLLEKIPLLHKKKLSEERIPKKLKPDLEAMTFAKIGDEQVLFIFGSGSRPKKREKLFVLYPDRNNKVLRVSLEDFYSKLNSKAGKGTVLNIEAAAANEKSIYLFHRGNISGKNIMFTISLPGFSDFIFNKSGKLPAVSTSVYILPQVGSIHSGFSGAALLDDKRIVFSASLEDTENEYDDGNVLGSFIGILNTETKAIGFDLLKKSSKPLLVKIESLCLSKSVKKKHILFAVTDSDGGDSEFLELELTE